MSQSLFSRRQGFSALVMLVWSLITLSAYTIPAQPDSVKIWVVLLDKGAAKHPHISSRESLLAYENLSVYKPYLKTLAALGFRIDVTLKWQNKISGFAPLEKLTEIASLPWVASTTRIPKKSAFPGLPKRAYQPEVYGKTLEILSLVKVPEVHKKLLEKNLIPGQGMKIAVIDNGFHLINEVFQSIILENRIIDKHDFVDSTQDPVKFQLQTPRGNHGAQALSLIGGESPGVFFGIAPKADFLLYRAENDTLPNGPEEYIEEDHVAAAIERAVDSGAHVISISLGYRYGFIDAEGNELGDIPFEDMDGRSRAASIAALGAARRNVLLVAAAGNEFTHNSESPTIVSPADADSIIAVGALDMDLKHCYFSSTGPTYDGRRKPEISAPGCPVPVADPTALANVIHSQGTSFSTPIVAGIAALLRQYNPQANAQAIRAALINSGHLAETHSDSIGAGMVNAMAALNSIGYYPRPGRLTTNPNRYSLFSDGKPVKLPSVSNSDLKEMVIYDIKGKKVGTVSLRPSPIVPRWENKSGLTGVFFVRGR